MKSMTGYGHAKGLGEKISIESSVRAVNGRFLEIRFHLPKEYLPYEVELKKIIQESFERGTIDLFISRKEVYSGATKKVTLNKEMVRQYQQAYKDLASLLKIKTDITAEGISRHSEVFLIESTANVDKAEKSLLFRTVKESLKKCDKERQREGLGIKKDVEGLLRSLHAEVQKIQDCRKEVNSQLLEKFQQKIRARWEGVLIDEQRLAQEIVMQIERSDINEELQRLSEHLTHYKGLFSSSEGIGKKLDFYTQELLREVNTIGSKSSVSKLTTSVVEAKALIEKLREQVQNIE
jgi:uncharacterized protein (TIGR00255 family)